MSRIQLVLAAFLFSTVGPALAGEQFNHQEGGVGFVVPDGWQAEPDADSIVVSSADGSLSVVFWVPEGNTWEAAVDGVFEALDSMIQDPQLHNEGEEGELNGMPLYELAGQGKIEGEPIEFSVSLFMARKPVIALAFSDPGAWAKNKRQLEKFVSSIRKN